MRCPGEHAVERGRTAREWQRMMVAGCMIVASGCAAAQNTPQQDYVWAMGSICDARVPFWKMEQVDPNGSYKVRGAPNMIPSQDNDYFKCMNEQFKTTPYREWLKNRPR
jgi:hypothetical protein